MVKVVAIVQARMNSKRLPGKVLKTLAGKSILELIYKRLKKSKLINEIIFALPDNNSSIPIVDFLVNKNINYTLGSENNLISRYWIAANTTKADYIVRITADCPFVEPTIIDFMLDKMLSSDIDLITNVIPPSWPDGLDINIFTYKTLKLAFKEAKLDSEREHVVPWMWNNSNLNNKNTLKAFNFLAPMDISQYRWTLDTEEDYNFFSLTAKKLSWKNLVNMSWKDFLSFYNTNQEILLVNNKIHRDEGYKNSLEKDKILEV